jgi:hypothetical protein
MATPDTTLEQKDDNLLEICHSRRFPYVISKSDALKMHETKHL